MYDPSLLKSEGKFTTEYKSELINKTQHELNHENYCDCGRKQKVHWSYNSIYDMISIVDSNI